MNCSSVADDSLGFPSFARTSVAVVPIATPRYSLNSDLSGAACTAGAAAFVLRRWARPWVPPNANTMVVANIATILFPLDIEITSDQSKGRPGEFHGRRRVSRTLKLF